ncbi:hypothetical protein ACX0G9_09330 [Flavitalea flava]
MNSTRNIIAGVTRPFKLAAKPRVWKRLIAENKIRRQQNNAIRRFDRKASKLVVFLVSGANKLTGRDDISGGVISIVSLCEESALLGEVHQAEVIMCTLPNEYLLFRHTQFVNQTDVFRLSQLRKYFKQAKEVIFHLPEFACAYFLENLEKEDKAWLGQLGKVHINIMNQNVRLMPSSEVLDNLKDLAHLVTATTAHQRYCSQHYREAYGMPLHKFSVWISPEKYTFRQYRDKENLIIVSPDERPGKKDVLEKLSAIPGLQVQIIRNLTYEQYKSTISRAKWALTFGEGLDGYIIEPVFSGSIGFAIYNEDFFTADFKNLPTIYASHDILLNTITTDMAGLDKEETFKNCQQEQFDVCAKYYSHNQYRENIRKFYQGDYTFK